MRTATLTLILCGMLTLNSPAQQATTAREEITFIADNQRMPDEAWQLELRHGQAWQQFLAAHGTWYVHFNEEAYKPHRAYGRPIPVAGSTPEQRALNFIGTELGAFGVEVGDLELMSVASGAKYDYVHFKQQHQGLEVLFSHIIVKLDHAGRVVGFGCDEYDGISVDVTPSIPAADAGSLAGMGLHGITGSTVESALNILPVPVWRGVEHHLVYEVIVTTQHNGMPGEYWSLVDAHSGEVLYRQNKVVSHDPVKPHASSPPPVAVEADITGNVYEFNPYIPAVTMPLAHVEATIGGTTYNADINGHLSTGAVGPVSGTFRLQGHWSTVETGGVTPQFNISLAEGANAVSFNTNANIRERSAYFHVNIVHDHCVSYLPTFTGMDFSLTTNVDVTGTCNAFYDGSSINFYSEGDDCQSYAQIGEVVYHEYGHGINDNFYQDNGANFNNGAMGEGYADVWGLSITEDPILAEGSSLSNPDDYIRRYDQDPKVYPVDLVGQVHADGEIIAGAWWDTYVLLGNDMFLTMTLFAEAYPGLQATAANGNEGTAFRDVLIDVLAADDDDGDITNGTPNGNEIVEAFAIHGITLISNAELVHEPLETSVITDPIEVNAELILAFPFTNYVESVLLRYRINNGAVWNDVLMNNIGGNDYQAYIPGQPEGTVIPYYLGVLDIFSQISAVVPPGADQVDPNIPYFILVGFALEATEDADNNNELGNWTTGMPGDNNTTGTWTLEIPVPSYATGGQIVQTDAQHTPGGELCFLTGNAPSSTDGMGTNDVDGGRTTLQCDPIDLTAYENPTFTIWRWYTNDPPGGANPGQDWWQVEITNNGSNWIYVENTRSSDRSWRRFAFRVQDYVTPNAQVAIRFIASDSIHLGQNLDGGSLIEAAIDDIQLWDNAGTIGISETDGVNVLNVYPTPASDMLNVVFATNNARQVRLEVLDAAGRITITRNVDARSGVARNSLDIRPLAVGSYVLRAVWEGGRAEQRFQIVR